MKHKVFCGFRSRSPVLSKAIIDSISSTELLAKKKLLMLLRGKKADMRNLNYIPKTYSVHQIEIDLSFVSKRLIDGKQGESDDK